MKKLILLSIVFFSVIITCGCSSTKTLTCTNSETKEGMKMVQTITMQFNNDKIKKIKMNISTTAETDELKKSWQMLANILDASFKIENSKGITISTKNDNKNYTYDISYDIDLTKANKEKLKELEIDNLLHSEESYEDTKKEAQQNGYTCK